MKGVRPAWALKAIVVIMITSIFFRCVCASRYDVGGLTGWDLRSNLLVWSSMITFHVGDDLVFTYTPIHDVVEVNQLGYDMCEISNAIGAYDSGATVIHLTEPGNRYFVCGRPGHCQQGLKLLVQVLALPNNGTDGHSNSGDNGTQGRESPEQPPSPAEHVPDSPHSGAIDIIADAAFLCHVLVPLITLVVLSYTHARLFFNFWRFLVLI
ncbi:uclacyanin 1-like [Senna tora]|uniref:Uclacyanin 1-like n=1 Tax=Senna tora TaxID=362788 RepID=A0A834T1A4_9FABA|nr:uclacyanin 1-like [Senna tora]